MTEIECTEQALVVHIQGADKFWALKSQMQVPWSHVLFAEQDPAVVEHWDTLDWSALRAPGTYFPGVIKAGSFRSSGQWMFCDVHDPHNAITIRLADEQYTRLVVEVADPDATISAIEQAKQSYQPS